MTRLPEALLDATLGSWPTLCLIYIAVNILLSRSMLRASGARQAIVPGGAGSKDGTIWATIKVHSPLHPHREAYEHSPVSRARSDPIAKRLE
jgi:hypothetical protein